MDREARRRREAVDTLACTYFGVRPGRVERVRGGHAADVFEFSTGQETYVVKLYPDVERAAWFEATAPVMERIAAAGVPAPRVLYHGGRCVPYAYLIYEKVPGVTLDAYEGDAGAVWQEVGAYVAQVNALPAPGYGGYRHGVAADPPYSASWRSYVEPEIDRLTEARMSEEFPAFEHDLRLRVRERLYALCDWQFEPMVLHANLTGSNIVVDPASGVVRALIDWDAMVFGPAPHGELGTALLWLDASARQAFLEGYGLAPESYRTYERGSETVRLLHLTRYLLWHLAHGNAPLVEAVREQIAAVVGAEPVLHATS